MSPLRNRFGSAWTSAHELQLRLPYVRRKVHYMG
jgi:hypothetical protein